ncbi:MAG: acyloxyacyl hydrolase [Chlamydiia bacterium]|nr:acyloxyacyl hydrolase [Chlamydiia bacterium]
MRYLVLLLMPLYLIAKPPMEDRRLLYAGSGVFNIVRNTKSAVFQLEYRSDYPLYRNSFLYFRPLIGLMGTSTGSGYLYGGIAFDIFLANWLVFTPSFAPGIYIKGGGMELGLPIEFRSSAELTYRFKNKGRFGAMFYHMSNASLGFKNPGTECLVFFYAIPL